MQRYFIHFAYDGGAYHGFQVQPNGNTIQAEIEKALFTLLRQRVEIVGAGRTDTGVHARHMVAHFDFNDPLEVEALAFRLNKVLPQDIAIQKIEQVEMEKHARFSAISRTYHYYIHTTKNPFLRAYSAELHYPLDFNEMNRAAQLLLKTTDFASFCKSHTDVKTTLCTVTEARWIEQEDGSWYFRITANRFLRNMVRAIVGTLIEVGRGRMSLADFEQVIKGKNRSDAGESMPACALFLERVEY